MATDIIEITEEQGVPKWSTGYWGSRFYGATVGVPGNITMGGLAQALQSGWAHPYDPTTSMLDIDTAAIGAMAADAGLAVYANEVPHTDTLERIRNKWSSWSGPPQAQLEAELRAATGLTARVFSDRELQVPTDGVQHWSRFYVNLFGDNVITGPSPLVGGSLVVDETLKLGPPGLTPGLMNAIKATLKRHKPAEWVCWDVWFQELGGTTATAMIHPAIRESGPLVGADPINYLVANRLSQWNGAPAVTVSPWPCDVDPAVQLVSPSSGQTPASVGGAAVFDGIDDQLAVTGISKMHWQQSLYVGFRIDTFSGSTSTLASGAGYAVGATETQVTVTVFPGVGDTTGIAVRVFDGSLVRAPLVGVVLEVFIDRAATADVEKVQVRIDGEPLPLASTNGVPVGSGATFGSTGGLTISPSPMSLNSVLVYVDPGSRFLDTYPQYRSAFFLGVQNKWLPI